MPRIGLKMRIWAKLNCILDGIAKENIFQIYGSFVDRTKGRINK